MSKAFTLIELLVTITIVGILAGVLFVSITGAMNSANDAKRKADISSIYSSILAQGTKEGYPNVSAYINSLSPEELKSYINNYLKVIPSDPKGIHQYFYSSNGVDFAVGAVLEDGTCFIKQTSPSFFDIQSCAKLKEGGIELVQNFMVLGGGGTYNLSWTVPSSFNIANPTTSTALICLGKTKTDSAVPTDSELLLSGTLVAVINGNTTYRYYASNADYNYYCRAITYNNTKVTNPGTIGGSPDTSSSGFGSNNSSSYDSSSPATSSTIPSASPPSLAGNTSSGGSNSPNFVTSSSRNGDGTGNITLSWTPGNMSTSTIIRRTESSVADPSIAPKTLSDGIEVYNKLNTLNGDNTAISPDSLHTYTDSNLNSNKYYCYSAWAYDSTSNTYSNGYVLACSGIPPTDISDLVIISTTNSINLSWIKGTGDKTVVRRKVNSAPSSFIDGELVYGSTDTSYNDDGSSTSTTLAKDTTYCYSVWSYTSIPGVLSKNAISGCSQLSSIGNPTNLAFPTLAYNSILVSWTNAPGSTSSIVVRKQGSIPTSRTDGIQVYDSTSTSFLDNNLTDSTNYCYSVWGYNGTTYSETPVAGCETTLAPLGSSSNPAASCKAILDGGQSQGSGVYWIAPGGDVSGKTQAYCDMVTDGGGWTMVMNYNSPASTVPALNYRINSFPLLGSLSSYVNEVGTQNWGHVSTDVLKKISFSEVRLWGKQSNISRIVSLKLSGSSFISAFSNGTAFNNVERVRLSDDNSLLGTYGINFGSWAAHGAGFSICNGTSYCLSFRVTDVGTYYASWGDYYDWGVDSHCGWNSTACGSNAASCNCFSSIHRAFIR